MLLREEAFSSADTAPCRFIPTTALVKGHATGLTAPGAFAYRLIFYIKQARRISKLAHGPVPGVDEVRHRYKIAEIRVRDCPKTAEAL
jgi:hypothetical protein